MHRKSQTMGALIFFYHTKKIQKMGLKKDTIIINTEKALL